MDRPYQFSLASGWMLVTLAILLCAVARFAMMPTLIFCVVCAPAVFCVLLLAVRVYLSVPAAVILLSIVAVASAMGVIWALNVTVKQVATMSLFLLPVWIPQVLIAGFLAWCEREHRAVLDRRSEQGYLLIDRDQVAVPTANGADGSMYAMKNEVEI